MLAVVIGGLILSTYRYEYSLNPDESQTYDSNIGVIQNRIIFGLGCVQAFSSFLLVVGFLVNNANLIVQLGWRERVSTNEIEMVIEKRQLQALRESQFSELQVADLDVKQLRLILQIEGPFSPVFFNEATGMTTYGGASIKFEYYWVSLTFLISNGQFIFNVMYFVFSIQGLLQSPVFYSFHLLDVINRFRALQNVIKSVTLNAN